MKNVTKGLSMTERIAKRNIAERIQKQISTNEGFMDFVSYTYGYFIKSDTTEGVGKMTVAADTMAQILLLTNKELFINLAQKALRIAIPELNINGGKGEFTCAFEDEIILHKKKASMVVMSTDIEDDIIYAIKHCDLHDANNLRKIYRVINDLFRMYQELTIDAAKKLNTISAEFYQEVVRAESTIHLGHNFSRFRYIDGLDKVFKIYRNGRYVLGSDVNVGEFEEFKNKNGETKKIIFRDELSLIQNKSIKKVEAIVNSTGINAYNNTRLSDETVAKLGLNSTLATLIMDIYEFIIKPYNEIIVTTAQNRSAINSDNLTQYEKALLLNNIDNDYKDEIENLSNLARFYTRKLSMVDAGRVMFAASNITVNAKEHKVIYKEDSTNGAYLKVAPELFFAYFTAEHAEQKECGHKLLGDVSEINEGEKITFVNGNAPGYENLYIDSTFTGVLTVKKVNDVLSVVMPIADLLEEKRIVVNSVDNISLRIYSGSVIDSFAFIGTKELVHTKDFDTIAKQQIVEKATKFTLVPEFKYTNSKGVKKIVHRAVVATIPAKDGSTTYEIPFCQYLVKSDLLKDDFAGLTFDKMNFNVIKGNTAWCKVSYGEFVEVEVTPKKEDPFNSTFNANDYNFEDAKILQEAKNNNAFAETFVSIIEDDGIASNYQGFNDNYDFPDADFREFYDDFDTNDYDFNDSIFDIFND